MRQSGWTKGQLMRFSRGAVPAVVLPVIAVCWLMCASAAAAPSGINDWSCQPSDSHPRPVVLVHGNGAGMSATWETLTETLTGQGYCVFALDYGKHRPGSSENLLDVAGGTDIETSSRVLSVFVDRVRTATGAGQVDIVGHSMGALTARQYLRFDGGTDVSDPSNNAVQTLVTVGGTNQGTTFGNNKGLRDDAAAMGVPANEAIAAAVGPAYAQQMAGSPFLQQLNAGGDTLPGIDYLAIATRGDEIITPADSAFLTPGPAVRNVWVQDGCPHLSVDHMALTTSPRALWLILTGLDPNHSTLHPAPCP